VKLHDDNCYLANRRPASYFDKLSTNGLLDYRRRDSAPMRVAEGRQSG